MAPRVGRLFAFWSTALGALSNFLENKVLDHVLRNTAYTSPATVYLALHTADPTEAGTGTEVSGGSYARQAVAFDAAASGATQNTSAVSFTNMPAATVTHVGVWDASTNGNLLFYGALAASKTTNAGDTFTVAAADLDIAID